MKIFNTLFLLLFLIGCKTGNNENISEYPENDSINADSVSQLDYVMVSPGEIFEYIFFEELKPDPSFVNPIANAKKYVTSYKMSVNLGVYTTDFIYLNLCSDKINTIEYYKTILEIAPKINIHSGLDENLPDRLHKNLTNRDSLDQLSRSVYYNILEDLEQEGRKKTYSLIAGGVIIESIYLAVMNVKNYEDYKPLTYKIFEQKEFLNNTYNFVSSIKKDEEIELLLSKLERLKNCFDNLEKTRKELKVNKNKSGHLEVKGGEEYIISSADFDNLKKISTEVRNEVISIK